MSLKVPFQNRPEGRKDPNACFNCENLSPDVNHSGNTYNAIINCELKELGRAASNGCEMCSFLQAAIDQLVDTECQSYIQDVLLTVSAVQDRSSGSLFQQFRNGENNDRSVFVTTRSSIEIHIGIRDNPKYRNVINGRTYDVILQGQSCNPLLMAIYS
jgi:hypothetical protein